MKVCSEPLRLDESPLCERRCCYQQLPKQVLITKLDLMNDLAPLRQQVPRRSLSHKTIIILAKIHIMSTIQDIESKTGRFIREARLGRDLTQAELARQSDVSLSSLQNLEAGRGVKLETFLRTLRTLDRLDIIDALDEGFSELSPMEALRLAQKKPARPQRASRRRN